MHTVLYEGGFEEWLSAVFAVYDQRLQPATIVRKDRFAGALFGTIHEPAVNRAHSERVWTGLSKKLSPSGMKQLYAAFLSEQDGIAHTLLEYVQHVFNNGYCVESDHAHPAVLAVQQAAKKVDREKHRMEAFVRFQKTADNLFYALIEPDHNVLPLIEKHFTTRYADQRWVIYDARRKYGIYYDLRSVQYVTISFAEATGRGTAIAELYDEDEKRYQQLWQQYFTSINISARKNRRLQLQQMPRRYWRFLTEQQRNG